MLRDAVSVRVKNPCMRLIPCLAQCLHDSEQDGAVIPTTHVRHIFEKDDGGSEMLHDFDEAPPQFGAPIDRVPLPCGNEAPDLRASSARKRLARRATRNEFCAAEPTVVHELDEA